MDTNTNTGLFRFFKNSFGNNQKFFISILITAFFGIIYSFGIYDYRVLLFIFGMFFPVLYIVGIYQMFRIYQPPDEEDSKAIKWFKNRYGNIVFMTLDILITLSIGILIYYGILDYILFKLLVTVILPVIYQFMIKFFLAAL